MADTIFPGEMLKHFSTAIGEKALLIKNITTQFPATALEKMPVLNQYATIALEKLPLLMETLNHYTVVAKSQVLLLTDRLESLHVTNWSLASTVIILYLSLVHALRFRNLRNINKKYAAYLHDPYSLDYKTAHSIITRVILYEAPFMYAFATQWALVKTYAIAPGTGLLVQTRQVSSKSTVGKRAEDTGILLTEFLVGSLDSERGSKALAKMNWLHRRYGSKIKQPELLHTLATFVLEPMRWFESKEWRPLTKLEKVAVYTYWKEIGNRMGIQNIPPTLEDLEAWVVQYEKTSMYYSDNNRKCADTTIRLFLRDIPPFMRGFAHNAVVSLLEENVRLALGYEKPPQWVAKVIEVIFQTRRFIIRHLFLPRFSELDPLPKPGSSGRLQRKLFAFEPWYVKSTWKNWLQAWFWTSGKVLPGRMYKNHGYLVEELGPVEYEKAAKEAVLGEEKEMQGYAAKGGSEVLGCPFNPTGYPFKYGV